MGMGMVPFISIAHLYLERIVPIFRFYVHENECMKML